MIQSHFYDEKKLIMINNAESTEENAEDEGKRW